MSALINSLLSYPIVVFTVLMGLSLLYWLFVIIGALDIDILDADGVFEAADGALEGAAEGAFEGAAEGAFEGAAEGAMEGAAEGAAEGAGEAIEGAVEGAEGAAEGAEIEGGGGGLIASMLAALNLRRAPVTVVFSLIVLFGWISSFIGMRAVVPLLPAAVPAWLSGTCVMLLSWLIALPVTSWVTRPLEPVFRTAQASRRKDFVGQVCHISTGRVDERFGQATLEDGGAGLVIQVRGDGELKRGQRALIVDYDAEREAYLIEAYDELLGDDASSEARR